VKYSVLNHLEVFVRSYIPSGPPWNAKNVVGSNFRNLCHGIAFEFTRADHAVYDFIQEMMPDTTDEYVGRWEKAVGIPDDCFLGTGTVGERRRDVVTKLAASGLQTSDDFVALAAIYGVVITCEAGIDTAVSFGTDKEARNSIVITFTELAGIEGFQDVPPNATEVGWEFRASEVGPPAWPEEGLRFGESDMAVLECLFSKLKPATAQLVFLYTGA